MSRTPSEVNPPPGRQGSDDLSFYLGRAYYNYVTFLQRLLRRFGLQEALKPGMGGVLFALFERSECIIKDLAAKLELAPSTLTSLIRRMEKAGLVACRRCSADGRAVRVILTEKGRALENPCRELSAALNGQLVQGLNKEEIQWLKSSLGQLVANMRAESVKKS